MTSKKSVQQRQLELRALLATPAGQKEIQELEVRYQKTSGRERPARTSVITYLLVHEREQGLISN
jgi:hypothetical protein